LVRFLEKCWKDFSVVYRAADRNPAYEGLLKVLAGPFHQEWYPGWILHWQIVAPEPPLGKGRHPLHRYVLQVQKLEFTGWKKK
jgi:hypothetical protein